MRNVHLHIGYDDGDTDWFALSELDGVTGRTQTRSLLASRGFELRHLREALTATGWVRNDDDRMVLREDMSTASIAEIVGEMFEYFTAPDVPSPELLDVRAAVDALELVEKPERPKSGVAESGNAESCMAESVSGSPHVQIPLVAYAWLDIMVREDLADEVRSTPNVWTHSHLEVDVECLAMRRVEQLRQRFGLEASRPFEGRMARSARQRKSDDQSARLG